MQRFAQKTAVSLYSVAAVLFYIIINQGGYFAGGIISVGIIVGLMLFRVRLRLKAFDIVFFVFSLWYLFCSVRQGFDLRYTAKGILPLLCLMFRQLLPKDSQSGEELVKKLINLSFVITAIALVLGVRSCIIGQSLRRLTFPFQYANTSGIFFGVMFILSRHGCTEKTTVRQIVFLLALGLTQSVGAIGLTVVAEIAMSRNLKQALIIMGVLIAGAVVLHGRVYQSIGTFAERFLQMRDGFVCMADNPVFGIGAGRWEFYKNLYQSGFYDAKEIHGSLAQIGAGSGVFGVLLFAASVVCLFRTVRFTNKACLAGIIMIICHGCLDFSLSFTAIGFIAMVLISCSEHKDSVNVSFAGFVPACVLAVCFAVLGTGMYQINRLGGINLAKNYPKATAYYESNILSRQCTDTKEIYAKALYAMGNKEKCLEVIKSMDVLSSDMVLLKKGCTGDWKEVMEQLKLQRYNPALYKLICYNSNDEELKKQAEALLESAVGEMSLLGKVIYKFKGEKVL